MSSEEGGARILLRQHRRSARFFVNEARLVLPIAQRFDARATLCAVGVAIVLAGCATAPVGPSAPVPSAPPLPRNAEPPPPSVNLSGFPLPYRQGYADGCASVAGPERKDAERFGGDPNYRMGWQDGLALCRRK
jgi:hypothetical protein